MYDPDIKYYELVFDNEDEGMCILGLRQPTPEEATEFVKNDLGKVYKSSKVVRVAEINKATAHSCFDMENEANMPVFGVKVGVHKVSNITSDEIIGEGVKRESDGKMCYLHQLVADRTYEDGTTDVQTTCILSQREYEEVQENSQYTYIYDERDVVCEG